MSEPHYKNGRHDRPHARIYDHHTTHPSWRALSGNAAKLITTLLAAYRPKQPNCFPLGDRRVADMIGLSPQTAKRIVAELVAAGYLRVERQGRNSGDRCSRERIVSLTRYDTETTVGNIELPIEVWRTNGSGPTKNAN